MSRNTTAKLVNLVNFRIRVTMADGRQLVGQMLAFDKYMNLVLADCEEFRRLKRKKGDAALEVEEKRLLGLAIVRGGNIVSTSIEAPPPADAASRTTTLKAGTGRAQPVGRGNPLAGPAAGVGFASPSGRGAPFPPAFER